MQCVEEKILCDINFFLRVKKWPPLTEYPESKLKEVLRRFYSISTEYIPSAWQYHTVPYRTEPKRCFSKIPIHLKVTLFTYRDTKRNIEKYAATTIVALNCNRKYTVTPTFTVIIVTACRYVHRYIFSDAWQVSLLLF